MDNERGLDANKDICPGISTLPAISNQTTNLTIEKGSMDTSEIESLNDDMKSNDEISDDEKWFDCSEFHGFENEFQNIGLIDKNISLSDMIRLKVEKSERRRIQAQQRKEIHKNKTMEKLLNKQCSKFAKLSTPLICREIPEPKVTYRISEEGNFILLSRGLVVSDVFRNDAKNDFIRLKKNICGVKGCPNIKRYTCSRSKIPLCSLLCYKKNLQESSESSLE